MSIRDELGAIAQQIIDTNDRSGNARIQRLAHARELDRLRGQLQIQENLVSELGTRLGEAARELVVTKFRMKETQAQIEKVDEAEVARLNRMIRLFSGIPNADDMKQIVAQVQDSESRSS